MWSSMLRAWIWMLFEALRATISRRGSWKRKANFQVKACYWNNHPNSPNMNLVRMFSLKPGACHHLPVVTGKVELRPVPGRKRPHEDVEVVEVWMVAFFKGAVESWLPTGNSQWLETNSVGHFCWNDLVEVDQPDPVDSVDVTFEQPDASDEASLRRVGLKIRDGIISIAVRPLLFGIHLLRQSCGGIHFLISSCRAFTAESKLICSIHHVEWSRDKMIMDLTARNHQVQSLAIIYAAFFDSCFQELV